MAQETVNLIAIIALAVLGVVCVALSLWCKYDDAIVGKCCLGLTALGCGLAVIHYREGRPVYWDAESAAVFLGMALFMLRHLARRLPRMFRGAPMRRAADRRRHRAAELEVAKNES